jgi:hypothetical protein
MRIKGRMGMEEWKRQQNETGGICLRVFLYFMQQGLRVSGFHSTVTFPAYLTISYTRA